MAIWLMKSEPEVYSIDDWARERKTLWTGVRNYQARNFMRDQMELGDKVLFYHSNSKPAAIVGEGHVSALKQVDPTQFDPKSEYYDPKAKPSQPIWYCVEVTFEKKWSHPITREDLYQTQELRGMKLLQKGQRLSVLPVSQHEYNMVMKILEHKAIKP